MFEELKFLNVGTPLFRDELEKQRVSCAHVDWKPAAGGDIRLIEALDRLADRPEVEAANREAADRIKRSQAVWIGMDLALRAVPGMTPKTILHAGPPIAYEQMCGPMQGAVQGTLLYEGLAEDAAGADRLARSGEITFSPCHEHGCVGPMAGIVSPSMPVHIVENRTFGNRSYSTVNEGLGKVLRFGANSQEVLDRLRYIKEEFFPVMRSVVELAGGVDLKNLTAQGLSMGDECHNRNKATTALLLRDLLPFFMEADFPAEVRNKAMLFLRGNEHYYLNLSMAACKCTLDAAHGVPNSTIVTTMARNGVEFGIRVSGMPVDCWFTGPAQRVEGLLFPGFQEEDAALDLGDSAITETCGIGGFAMAAAPAIVQFVGGCVEDAFRYSRQMYEITETESGSFFLPPLDFRGSATGIDLRKVVEAGILPVINTGIAHREAGVGQIGAGIVHPPMACFEKALLAFS